MRIKRELYRDAKKGKVAGVCAGIAAHFGWELWLIRIIFVSGMLLTGGSFFILGYFIAWMVLEKKPDSSVSSQQSKQWHSKSRASHEHAEDIRTAWREEEMANAKVEVKSRVWQAGEPPLTAFYDIERSFDGLESRLRKMESYVTSSEFQLNREFKKL